MKKMLCLAVCIIMIAGAFFSQTAVSFAGYIEGVKAMKYKGMTIPKYDGDTYEKVNGNKPSFTSAELKKAKKKYEKYSSLDSLGRAGRAQASLHVSLMPRYERGSISSVYPTGWVQNSYSFVPGGWLYNRAHLIGFQLTGVDSEHRGDVCAKALISGTRQMNAGTGNGGMIPFENKVSEYLKNNPKGHVLYRVTPVYGGKNLLSYGVLMEAKSPEDPSLRFCVFCYNVQKGVSIDYATGKNTSTPKKTKITKISAAKGKIVVAYKKVSDVKGYQIAYRKKGTSGWSSAASTGVKKTIKGLKSAKYQVAVRTYKVYEKCRVYGKFCKVKTVEL